MTRFEDILRVRETMIDTQPFRDEYEWTEISVVERDALADAVEALRVIADGDYEGQKLWEHKHAAAVIARLDGAS